MPSVPVEHLASEPYISVLCYPSQDRGEAERRIGELKRLDVVGLVFEGRVQVGRLHVLGKGCVSLVVKAEVNSGVCALKIRRVDANRPFMRREAELHMLANRVGVGPSLHSYSDDFILMELVEGEGLVEWVKRLEGRGSTKRLRAVLKEVLDQCFRLDEVGLDHGQLSNLEKHVYVGRRIWIIDFETASTERRVSNVTSATQSLFIGGPVARRVRRMLRVDGIESVIQAIREYKRKRGRGTYEALLKRLKLTDL